MCLRKLQNWSLSVIFSEFTRFTRDSHIHSTESEFVEMFTTEIFIPPRIPQWLWQGQRISKHPTLKIKLIEDKQQEEEQKKSEPPTPKKTSHSQWKEDEKRKMDALSLEGTSSPKDVARKLVWK